MLEDLLKAASAPGASHSHPEIPESLLQTIPAKVTAQDLQTLWPEDDGTLQDVTARLWATYAILKSGKLVRREDDGDEAEKAEGEGGKRARARAALEETAARISSAITPILQHASPEAETDDEEKDYAPLARRGELGLLVLSHLASTPSPSLIPLTAFTSPQDPWTTPASCSLSRSLLASSPHLSTRERRAAFVADAVLGGLLRPLFAASRPAAVTASGRRAEFVGDDDGGTARRYDDRSAGRETAEAKPWKYASRYAVTVFGWAVEVSDQSLLKAHWPRFTPVLLTLLDDPTPSVKLRGLAIFRLFWARCPAGLMASTGLADVFEQAVFPCVLNLPALTPEDESVAMLDAAYPALFQMAGVDPDPDPGRDDAEPPPMPPRSDYLQFTEAQRKLLDKIVREGIMVGYHHAKEHIRLVELLCEKLHCIVKGMGILALKHLKDFIPMVSEIMTDPFGTRHPPTLLSATKLLQAILCTCWPRIPHYCNEIVKALMLCWLNIEDEESYPKGNPNPAAMKSELTKTVDMLSATMKAAKVDMTQRLSPLIEKEPQLRNLFGNCATT